MDKIKTIGVGGLPVNVYKIDGHEYITLEDFQLILKFKNLQISHLERYIDENCSIKKPDET